MSNGVSANQAWIGTFAGIPITAPLVDNIQVGSFWVRLAQSIGMGPTPIAINLTRLPTFFLATTNNGATVFQEAGDVAVSTDASFVCRATQPTLANLMIA